MLAIGFETLHFKLIGRDMLWVTGLMNTQHLNWGGGEEIRISANY